MKLNIIAAEIRIEDGYARLYVKPAQGPEFLAAGGKAFMLAWGVARLPEEIKGEDNIAFLDADDEESEMVNIENSTRDPVYVHLCRVHYVDALPPRKLKIPTVEEAQAARWKAYPDGRLVRVK